MLNVEKITDKIEIEDVVVSGQWNPACAHDCAVWEGYNNSLQKDCKPTDSSSTVSWF